jgi:Methyltransferase domain
VTGPPRQVFDAAYYRRFYRERPVHDRRTIGHLATGVMAFSAWWGISVRSVLDVGAGTGLWRGWFAAERPRVAYRSVDVSDYACRRYGHEQADISRWRPDTPSDLVVCQGVLQYLDDEACSRAVGNLAAACSALLYLEVPTAGDLRDVIDTDATDLDIYWRTGSWYRRRLGRHFRAIGGGLFAARAASLHFYELETAGPPHATAAREASEKTR